MENIDIQTSLLPQTLEEKYIQNLNQQYEQTISRFPKENRLEKEQTMKKTFQTVSDRLSRQEHCTFGTKQKTILKLKCSRHFQYHNSIDENNLFDSIVETPTIINSDKGSLEHGLEIHEQKTLQRVAEMRKRRNEITGEEDFNPYQALCGSKSGNYYLVRLLNMPHLQEESTFMRHCVGTSTSYLNRMKKGEIEIFSFRRSPTFNPKNKKLEGDSPLLTIEYDPKNGVINQIKKQNDQYLSSDDPFLDDFIEILKRLSETKTDAGIPREIKKINSSELNNLKIKPYHLLTDKGTIHFRNLHPEENPFILKIGEIKLTPDISREDRVKFIKIFEKLDFTLEQIACTPNQINEDTKAYVGSLVHHDSHGTIIPIFDLIQQYNVEHIYTAFPEGKIIRTNVEIGYDPDSLPTELKAKLNKIKDKKEKEQIIQTYCKENMIQRLDKTVINHITSNSSDYAKDMIRSNDFTVTLSKKPVEIPLVHLKVRDLGFEENTTTAHIIGTKENNFTDSIAYKLGLELCPAELGVYQRFKDTDQPSGEYYWIAMKPITDRDGSPDVFRLYRRDDGLWLNDSWAASDNGWRPGYGFVFRSRKLKPSNL